MDSLTQIVLGAAVAEVVGGRKLGNKAMMWGAVAGTIPDLDVFAKFFMSPIDSLAAHRGFSHSILFSILGSILLAYLVKWIYSSKWYRTIASGSYYLLTILILVGINLLSFRSGNWLWYLLPISGLVMAAVGWLLYRKYNKENLIVPDLTTRDWGWLFFWSIFTHPLLDCFTAYGTQLFYPFSHYRVAFNNISVVDPGYTIFLILALLVAARLVKTSRLRRKINIAGLVLSSVYMSFTLYNKYRVGTIFKSALQENHISYNRYMTNPTIFNNILWYGIAESDSAFHYGFYSLLDKDKEWVLSSRKKTQKYIKANLDNHIIGTLDWFSNGYNGMTPFVNDTARYYDYRYGPILMDGKETNPFAMIIVKNPDGSLKMIENTPATNKKFDKTKAIKELYKRIGF